MPTTTVIARTTPNHTLLPVDFFSGSMTVTPLTRDVLRNGKNDIGVGAPARFDLYIQNCTAIELVHNTGRKIEPAERFVALERVNRLEILVPRVFGRQGRLLQDGVIDPHF